MKGRKRLLLDLKEALFHSERDERMQRRGREETWLQAPEHASAEGVKCPGGPRVSGEAVERPVASATTKGKDKMKWMLLSLPLHALPSIPVYGNGIFDKV